MELVPKLLNNLDLVPKLLFGNGDQRNSGFAAPIANRNRVSGKRVPIQEFGNEKKQEFGNEKKFHFCVFLCFLWQNFGIPILDEI
jgi:hypothetical protein